MSLLERWSGIPCDSGTGIRGVCIFRTKGVRNAQGLLQDGREGSRYQTPAPCPTVAYRLAREGG